MKTPAEEVLARRDILALREYLCNQKAAPEEWILRMTLSLLSSRGASGATEEDLLRVARWAMGAVVHESLLLLALRGEIGVDVKEGDVFLYHRETPLRFPDFDVTPEEAAKTAGVCAEAPGEELPPDFKDCRACRQPFTHGERAGRVVCETCIKKYNPVAATAKKSKSHHKEKSPRLCAECEKPFTHDEHGLRKLCDPCRDAKSPPAKCDVGMAGCSVLGAHAHEWAPKKDGGAHRVVLPSDVPRSPSTATTDVAWVKSTELDDLPLAAKLEKTR